MSRPAVIDQNLELVRQGLTLVNGIADDVYAAEDVGSGSGLGPHIRHVIEFYRALFEGLASGRVDYDRRDRDRDIETRRAAATAAFEEIAERLDGCASMDPDLDLRVNVDAETRSETDITWSRSSLLRELQFALSHTVHHYALISRQLQDRGVELERNFGVAPSTLAAGRAPAR